MGMLVAAVGQNLRPFWLLVRKSPYLKGSHYFPQHFSTNEH